MGFVDSNLTVYIRTVRICAPDVCALMYSVLINTQGDFPLNI